MSRPFGFKHSEETKNKMSKKRKGIKLTQEHIKNISIGRKGIGIGRKCREDTKKKIGKINSSIGQRKLMNNGYIRITISTYPNYKREYEHRFILGCHLGRKLSFNETAHHINGVKTDNRIENLQLIERHKHNRIHAIDHINKGGHDIKFIKIGGYNG